MFPLRQFYKILFSKYFLQDNSLELYFQNIPFEAILQNCILKTFHLRQLSGVVFPYFPFRQFCGIVFSKYSLWDNFTELYSQNISSEVTLWSCILKTLHLRQFYWIVFSKHFIWGNFAELYSQNTFFEAILLNCILKIFPFEAIPWNCVLTLSLLGQLCRVAFPQMFEDIISPCE